MVPTVENNVLKAIDLNCEYRCHVLMYKIKRRNKKALEKPAQRNENENSSTGGNSEKVYAVKGEASMSVFA